MAEDTTETLYERVGGTSGIAGAVDLLVEWLYTNASTLTHVDVPEQEHNDEVGDEGRALAV